MSLLWGAADDGSGNAALTSRRLPDRLPRRIRNLVGASVVGAIVAIGAAQIAFGEPPKEQWQPQGEGPVPSATSSPPYVPTATPTAAVPSPGATIGRPPDLTEYAVAVTELQGLPPDVQPGQPFELWVAWDPAVSEGPQIRLLMKQVTIARFIEPTTFQGPVVAVLSVPRKRVADLMYGDRFGSFNVSI